MGKRPSNFLELRNAREKERQQKEKERKQKAIEDFLTDGLPKKLSKNETKDKIYKELVKHRELLSHLRLLLLKTIIDRVINTEDTITPKQLREIAFQIEHEEL